MVFRSMVSIKRRALRSDRVGINDAMQWLEIVSVVVAWYQREDEVNVVSGVQSVSRVIGGRCWD